MTAFKLGCLVALFVALSGAATVAADVSIPKPISSELPTYPERARAARVTGKVRLWFVVSESGEVTNAQVISGNILLRDTTVAIVKSWKFKPHTMQPNVRYETEFVYVLEVQPKKGDPTLTVSLTDFRRIEIVSEVYVEAIE